MTYLLEGQAQGLVDALASLPRLYEASPADATCRMKSDRLGGDKRSDRLSQVPTQSRNASMLFLTGPDPDTESA